MQEVRSSPFHDNRHSRYLASRCHLEWRDQEKWSILSSVTRLHVSMRWETVLLGPYLACRWHTQSREGHEHCHLAEDGLIHRKGFIVCSRSRRLLGSGWLSVHTLLETHWEDWVRQACLQIKSDQKQMGASCGQSLRVVALWYVAVMVLIIPPKNMTTTQSLRGNHVRCSNHAALRPAHSLKIYFQRY